MSQRFERDVTQVVPFAELSPFLQQSIYHYAIAQMREWSEADYTQFGSIKHPELVGFTFKVDSFHTIFNVFPVFKTNKLDEHEIWTGEYEYYAVAITHGIVSSWFVSPQDVQPFFAK